MKSKGKEEKNFSAVFPSPRLCDNFIDSIDSNDDKTETEKERANKIKYINLESHFIQFFRDVFKNQKYRIFIINLIRFSSIKLLFYTHALHVVSW